MPITRLDMISIAPKTQEAGNQRQQEIERPMTNQQNIAGSVQQQARQMETQTNKMTQTKNDETKYDAKEGRGNASYGGSSDKKKEQEQKEAEERKRMFGSTFDITI